ncbi:MAG: VTC domain-containing protein [Halobacteriovorax sp.]|nr:VTC domain-containing protein [Halobacteriovorax sp.]|tara:strand:+ start:183990 stop:184784 length:795 start_codon:yes stop_codon:yes gene_type:complete
MEASSPLFFERYELKYLIPEEMIEPISQYAETYCVLDPYSERSPDKFYGVNNLYLDTPNFLFLERRKASMDDRFNLRIRSYGDEPVYPYFLEVKFKSKGFIKKKRSKVYGDDWANELNGITDPDFEGYGINTDYRNVFHRLVHSYNAAPKVFTQYKRKAYLSVYDDYARVTFDRQLRYTRREEYNLKPIEGVMSAYDFETNYNVGANIILELKCTSRMPMWMLDLIAYFNLERTSFSKYMTGVNEVIPDHYAPAPYRIPAHCYQ